MHAVNGSYVMEGARMKPPKTYALRGILPSGLILTLKTYPSHRDAHRAMLVRGASNELAVRFGITLFVGVIR